MTATERPEAVTKFLEMDKKDMCAADITLCVWIKTLESRLSEAEKVIDEIDVTHDITDIWKLTAAYRSQSQEKPCGCSPREIADGHLPYCQAFTGSQEKTT